MLAGIITWKFPAELGIKLLSFLVYFTLNTVQAVRALDSGTVCIIGVSSVWVES
jgi:hypothetical protein